VLRHDYVFWPVLAGLIAFSAFFAHRNEQRRERAPEPTAADIRRAVQVHVAIDVVLALACVGFALARLAEHGWRLGLGRVVDFLPAALMLAAIVLILRAGARARRDLRVP
jgi:hypothetical protein